MMILTPLHGTILAAGTNGTFTLAEGSLLYVVIGTDTANSAGDITLRETNGSGKQITQLRSESGSLGVGPIEMSTRTFYYELSANGFATLFEVRR